MRWPFRRRTKPEPAAELLSDGLALLRTTGRALGIDMSVLSDMDIVRLTLATQHHPEISRPLILLGMIESAVTEKLADRSADTAEAEALQKYAAKRTSR